MKLVQSGVFFRTIKKLHKKEKTAVDRAIERVIANTSIGDMKKGVLTDVRVYKFKADNKQYLLAYRHEKKSARMTLSVLGSYENFYRDLST